MNLTHPLSSIFNALFRIIIGFDFRFARRFSIPFGRRPWHKDPPTSWGAPMTALPDSLSRYIRMLIVHGTWPSDGEVQMLPLASPASGSSGPTGLSGSVPGPSEPLTSTTPCMSPSLSIPTTHAFGGTYPARFGVALRCGEPMAQHQWKSDCYNT